MNKGMNKKFTAQNRSLRKTRNMSVGNLFCSKYEIIFLYFNKVR